MTGQNIKSEMVSHIPTSHHSDAILDLLYDGEPHRTAI